jgi:DNA-directed RNA polymerase subunit RPC12/RpoP
MKEKTDEKDGDEDIKEVRVLRVPPAGWRLTTCPKCFRSIIVSTSEMMERKLVCPSCGQKLKIKNY